MSTSADKNIQMHESSPAGKGDLQPPELPAEFGGGHIVLLDVRERERAVDFKGLVAPELRFISQSVLDAACADRPTLCEHVCTDDGWDDEPQILPHLIEHLAIDLLAQWQRERGEARAFAGYTVWLDRRRGLARVTLANAGVAVAQTAMARACELASQYVE